MFCLVILFKSILSWQVNRASLRLEGVQYLLEVLGQEGLLSSVRYAAMCGWLGVFGAKSRLEGVGKWRTHLRGDYGCPSCSYSPCVVRPHYLSGVERIPPVLQTVIELHFHQLESWAHTKLRSAICEADHALKQPPSSSSSPSQPSEGKGVGSLASSRFIMAALAMLTSEHEAVDLSLLLNNGVLGLSQTVLRLSGIYIPYLPPRGNMFTPL